MKTEQEKLEEDKITEIYEILGKCLRENYAQEERRYIIGALFAVIVDQYLNKDISYEWFCESLDGGKRFHKKYWG